MQEIDIDHCVIHVSDWVRSTKFYCEVMGGDVLPAGNGWSFRFGNAQLNCAGPNVHGGPVARLPVQPGW